jgi:Sulfotransferase domain
MRRLPVARRLLDMTRGPLANPAREVARQAMIRSLSGLLPLYIVNEYPKSGGTWLSHMLARALDVPFPQHRLPPARSCIIHGHFLRKAGLRNVVILWRDGRDVLVSWYYHSLLLETDKNTHMQQIVQEDLRFQDPYDIGRNLPRFIEYAFSEQRHPPFSWVQFVRAWRGQKCTVTSSYEALRRDTPTELRRVVLDLTAHQMSAHEAEEIAKAFAFESMAGKDGASDPARRFVRKGLVGEWRKHFGLEARQLFEHHAGRELIALGYEQDASWVRG